MGAIMQGAVTVAVSLALGLAGTAFAAGVLRRRDERAAGIRALAAMSWREFLHLLLAAMTARGFVREDRDDGAQDTSPYDSGDVTLQRGPERLRLWCKHGSAFVIGKLTVNELAGDMRLTGAQAGLLVTQGRVVDDARDTAAALGIELLDGPALWPQIRGQLSPQQLAPIRAVAARRARARITLVWLIALAAGVVAAGVARHLSPDVGPALPGAETSAAAAPPATMPDTPPSGADATPSQASAAPPADEDDSAEPRQPAAVADQTPLSPQDQRTAAAAAVRSLPTVERAAWTSASTLEVDLLAFDDDAFARICPLLARHPDIATSRIQLNLPRGGDVPVRFRQCRTP